MTIIDSHSHVDSQVLGEDHHCLVHVFLWQLFPDGLQGDFQLISRLRLLAGVYGTPPAWRSRRSRRDSPADSSLESLGATRSSQ